MTLAPSDLAARAAAAVDPERATADLAALVRVPSITGSEEAVQDLMAALMADAGLEVARIATDPVVFATDPDFPGAEMPRTTLPVVVGRLPGTRPGPRVLLVGHVDVVPIGDPGNWTDDPFGATVRDGRLFGRGACDMKAASRRSWPRCGRSSRRAPRGSSRATCAS